MLASDVLAVLDLLDGAGARVWVDGGWGVDALVGRITREHSDLDLVVRNEDLDLLRATLADAGFTVVLRDLLPAALALAHADGREIDLHPITPAGAQLLPDGTEFHYPPPVVGHIDGVRVSCVDATTQVSAHHGYPQRDRDRHDMALLVGELGAT